MGDGPRMNSKKDLLKRLELSGAKVPRGERDIVWRFIQVLLANSFDLPDANALYLWLSRSNHSCEPNAVRATISGGGMAVVALRQIRAGEEICISYVIEQTLQ